MTVSFIVQRVKHLKFDIVSLPALLIITVFSSCSCPDDVVLGQLSLKGKSNWPFQGSENFTYVNKDGQELIFTGTPKNAVEFLPTIKMARMCTKRTWDYQDAYYSAEYYSYQYHLNSEVYFSFIYGIANDIWTPPTSVTDTILYETFYPILVAPNTSDLGPNCNFRQLVSSRGNSLKKETLELLSRTSIIADTTLNGVQYDDLVCNSQNPGLFYSKKFGVVLFYYNHDWWYLKQS